MPATVIIALAVLVVASGCSGRGGALAPSGARVPMPPGLLASRGARERGRHLFLENCAICHGEQGDGRGPRSTGMVPPPTDLTKPPSSGSASAGQIYLTIRDGVAGSAMPSWRILSDRQIWDLVAYVHSLGES